MPHPIKSYLQIALVTAEYWFVIFILDVARAQADS